jgi:hypothetical protein
MVLLTFQHGDKFRPRGRPIFVGWSRRRASSRSVNGVHLPRQDSIAQNSIAKRACFDITPTLSSNTT